LLSRWREHRQRFPHQPERTRCNRQRRALAPAINWRRRAIVDGLDGAQDAQCIRDSLPIPVVPFSYVPQANTDWTAAGATCGHGCSKKPAIFGYQLALLVTPAGLLRDLERAPANLTDREVGAELLEAHAPLQLVADKGSISRPLAQELRAQRALLLRTVPRRNQTPQPWVASCHLHAHLRPVLEVVNRHWALPFQIETTQAHSFWGPTARLSTQLAAQTLGVWLNRLVGVPDLLRLKCLAFPNN